MSESTVDDPVLTGGHIDSKDSFGSHDTAGAPLRPTFVDAAGTERIAGPPAAGWEPAQVEPSEAQIKAMEDHNAREAERSAARQALLTDTDSVGETAQPLVDANKARAEELQAAKDAQDEPEETEEPAEPETPVETPELEETKEPEQVEEQEQVKEPDTPVETPARKTTHARKTAEAKKEGEGK